MGSFAHGQIHRRADNVRDAVSHLLADGVGANYPSELLSSLFGGLEEPLRRILLDLSLPPVFVSALTEDIPRIHMGALRNAAADGDLLSDIHAVRGLRDFTPHCLQPPTAHTDRAAPAESTR